MSELTSAIIGVDVGLVILIIIQMFKPTPRCEIPTITDTTAPTTAELGA